jgi:NDP-sugar pyrophosphorylase family protein
MSQIVLIAAEGDQLVGVLTDGDIRRAILGGAALESPVGPHVIRDCFTVADDAGRADVLELMQARHIAQVPVVGPGRRIMGLHLLQELISTAERPNWAVVMAGGRGSRLGDLTRTIPKPMLPVAGRPILERIVLHLVGSGVRRIYLSVNYLPDVIVEHFGDGSLFGCSIAYLHEEQPLGTAGSLALLPRGSAGPQDPLLVMNGDLVTQADVGRLIDFHEAGGQAITVAVRRHFEPIPFGCVDVDGDELVGFREKPTTEHLISAGIYVLQPDTIDLLAPGEPTSMPDLISTALRVDRSVRVLEVSDDWIDVGRRDQLDLARRGE